MRHVNATTAQPTDRRRQRRSRLVVGVLAVALVAGVALIGRSIGGRGPAAALTPGPLASATLAAVIASGTPVPTALPMPAPTAGRAPLPTPAPGPVDANLAPNPEAVFSSQLTKEMCAPAGLTSALATMGLVRASNAVQREIESRIGDWTSHADSLNGGWGPLAMTRALAAYGAPGYVVRTFKTRDAALRASAIALSATGEPVLLLAWWGAHTWVMTGYRATGNLAWDPAATFTGAYIVDPWYPRVSSIWGHVNPPGHFYDMAGMKRNYIAWTRPEGHYPDRDGRWVAVIPTRPLPSGPDRTLDHGPRIGS